MFNIGDLVELILSDDEINQIINDNLELEDEIMECFDKQVGTIVEVIKKGSVLINNYYVLDSNRSVAWKESELRLINWN